MKNTFLTLILTFFVSVSFAKEIEATVVFENLTGKEFKEGGFFITETNQKIKITKADSFKIKLPESGKYQFSFTSSDFTAFVFYPMRVTKRKNTITIRLMEKDGPNNNGVYSFPMNLETNLTNEQIEQRIKNGTLNFIMHGIDNSIPKEYLKFKEKYGIGLIKENCAIDPLSFKKATENNQMLFDYLNKNYGTEWQDKLQTKPLGIQ